MLEIQRLRNDKDAVLEALNKRSVDYRPIVEEVLSLDEKWRSTKSEMEEISSKMNKGAKEIGSLFKQGKIGEANALKEETASLKKAEGSLKEEVQNLEKEIQGLMFQLPNTPNELVKKGKNELDNEVVLEYGEQPDFGNLDPMPHWELAKKYELIDFELGVKITGAGFPVYKGKGARLQRAMISYFLDKASEAGYVEHIPPHMVNEASGIGTGQLPDKEGQMYHATVDNLYLIPTAEVPLTNIYRDVILPNEDFSIKICGYTPCFRREAGSYGKDVRGLNRLHQFDKVEIVRVEHPDQTAAALDEMVEHVGDLLKSLGLQFRILRLCGGDTGFASSMTYDFEVYSAAQDKWLEVSSVSRFDSFQTNRLKLRFKDSDNKTKLCHTLNGSALALPRVLAAILENYQTAEGISIPEVLVPYCGFDQIT